ncbi:MAG: hypothetical protein OYL97_06530 [Candidatus Poribacteria bacterium]|nr:hypothetical protein [Candidatus Poribacteria bacterium]
MQSRLTWLVFAILAMGIMSIGIVGCGSDTEEESAEKPTESSSTTSAADEPVVAARPPIDFDAEKAAIQDLYSAFYKAFNDNDIGAVGETFNTSTIEFGTIFAGNEPVPVATGWNDVKTNILGLWNGIGTKGAKWGQNDKLSDFWIRYKGSKLEAAAIGYNCYKGAFPGETHLYLLKDDKGWKIYELDSSTQNNLGIFGFHKGKPRIQKFIKLTREAEKL